MTTSALVDSVPRVPLWTVASVVEVSVDTRGQRVAGVAAGTEVVWKKYGIVEAEPK